MPILRPCSRLCWLQGKGTLRCLRAHFTVLTPRKRRHASRLQNSFMKNERITEP